jgi:hypothetical protein
MAHSDPVHVIDFRNTLNCTRIEYAKPGEELDILVRLERPADSPSVRAKGRRSADGTSFEVTVPTEHGPETHSWTWAFLQDALRAHRGTPG